MKRRITEYENFLNESIDPQTAIQNIIEVVQTGMGWIDPDYAIEIFGDMTGIPADNTEVDTMLAALADLDLLYYEDDSVSNKKGKKVEFGEIELKEYPHRAPDDSIPMKASFESKLIKIKSFDDFN